VILGKTPRVVQTWLVKLRLASVLFGKYFNAESIVVSVNVPVGGTHKLIGPSSVVNSGSLTAAILEQIQTRKTMYGGEAIGYRLIGSVLSGGNMVLLKVTKLTTVLASLLDSRLPASVWRSRSRQRWPSPT